MKDDTKLRYTFNEQAQLYNDIRPRYPDALFDRLIEVTGLPLKAKLVEIGPGTGQATKPLAERGYEITAIELGADLADVARHELQPYPNVKVITGSFEDVSLPAQAFDLVFAATAFHWIKPDARYNKPHQILKPCGHLAIIHTNHVSDEQGDRFFKAAQPMYDRYFFKPSRGDKPTLPKPDSVEPTELDNRLFQLTHFQGFPVVINYSAKDYTQLLNTFSPNLALPEDQRTAFLSDIQALINEQFSGNVAKHLVMSLTIAKKLS